jgi:predicted dehydrogenase
MARSSRREFLEQSMWTTAAAVASQAGLVHAVPALADESKSPANVLRVGVAGLNGRGQSHLGGFMGIPGCEVVAVCDPDAEVLQKKGVEIVAGKTKKAPTAYADIRKMLEDKSLDIISIATPNHWHALGAIWAIQAGKDVYVEKPVSHNVMEGRRIVDAARKYNKICQTGTQSRSALGVQKAVAFLQEGKLGEVKVARALCYKPRGSIGARGNYAVPASVNYDLWAGPAPMSPLTRPKFHYDWHWQWDCGNGDLGNQGIHQMDVARWGLGVSDVGNGVFSYGGRFGYEDAGDTANTQVSVHDYGDKTLVFEVRGLKTPDYKGAKVGVIFECAGGYLVVNGSTGVAFDKEGKKLEEFTGDSDHFANFVKAVRSRQVSDLNADILEGHLSSALCHLGNISYHLSETVSVAEAQSRLRSIKPAGEGSATFERFTGHLAENNVNLDKLQIRYGATLAIDPKTETFTGGMADKANPMLTREYRKGFEVPATAEKV